MMQRDRKEFAGLISIFFNSKLTHEIDTKRIESLDSDENKSKSEFSNFLQLSDILLGVVRLSFVELGNNQKGQKECIENYADIIERFNNKKKAYNNCSKYWKKFCIQFFPTQSNLTRGEFLSDNIEKVIKRGSFYCDRLTHKECMAKSQNLGFNFKL